MDTDLAKLKERACEAFIRRAAEVAGPFALKGSYLSRQFFPDIQTRIPQDLDWYCTQEFGDFEEAEKLFQIWLLAVLATKAEDGVKFANIVQDELYWQNSDYVMYNYFATVNTDLLAYVDGQEVSFQLEISFNWPVPFQPEPFEYQGLDGEKFTLPNIAPLHTQLAWKMHQCAIEPRMKDFVDIYFMLAHPSVEASLSLPTKVADMVRAELEACNGEMYRFAMFLRGDFAGLFRDDESADFWEFWRADQQEDLWNDFYESDTYSMLFRSNEIPYQIEDFWMMLADRLEEKGFNAALLPKR